MLFESPMSCPQQDLNQVPVIQAPPTPPSEGDDHSQSIIASGIHILSTEARALQYLENFYRTDWTAQSAFAESVQLIARTVRNRGKVVVCGVGKSGRIGEKFVATLNSLSLTSVFLHAAEAVHGDLGMIRSYDLMIFITFSGKTGELMAVMPHLPSGIPTIVITSHTTASACELLQTSIGGYVLPAPIPESEITSFGLPTPTTSTTVALALADALALSAARFVETLTGRDPADVFAKNHPGGAIGDHYKTKR